MPSTQGEGHPGLERQGRVAAGEDQPQPVVLNTTLVAVLAVAEGVVARSVEVRHRRHLLQLDRLGRPAA
jgi:hypothetical protein